MNIQYLVTSLEGGGGAFSLPRILRTIEQSGSHVQLSACEPRDGLGGLRLRDEGFAFTLLADRKRNKLFYLRTFIKQVRRERPDVIWTSLSVAGLVGQITGRLCGLPVVSWMNNANAKPYTRLFSRFTDLWIADSPSVQRYLRENLGIPAQKIMVWPLYCATTPQTLPHYWQGNSPLHLGSLGRLNEQKNYAALIRAIGHFFENAPQWRGSLRVSLAGDGPLHASLQDLIDQLGLNGTITLMGHQNDPDAFLLTLGAYIQPSLYEGMCLAAHEAMAIGLPVIATPVGELAHSIIRDQTGFVIGQPVEESIAAILEEIFMHPSKLEHYGRAGRALVRTKFSTENFHAAGLSVLERIRSLLTHS